MATETLKADALIKQESQYGAHNYHPLDVVLCKGEGIYVWDVEGKRYVDFLAAYSAVNQGHNHPRIVKALTDQASELALTSRAFRNDKFPPLLEKLCKLTGFEKALLMNSGAEAVETALKCARKWGTKVKGVPEGQAEIIVFSGNFHGRTTTIVSFSDDELARDGYGPYTSGFTLVPYCDLEAVKAAVKGNTVAILVEPIQGEGGVVIPPAGFLKGLREICDDQNVLLICDEIQAGLGRTGALFAFEHEDIRPDAVTIGKALSGGLYPVSAFLADNKLMNVFTPGSHGSTYGGNPLACAVASVALDVMVDEDLIGNSKFLGEYLLAKVKGIDSKHIKEVRGKGLWLGIELYPEAGGARRFCEHLQDEGILCKETHTNTIRLAPPLVITREEIDSCLNIITKVLEQD